MNTDSSSDNSPTVELRRYRVTGYSPGAGLVRRALWYLTNAVVFASPFCPSNAPKRLILRAFGASVGEGVVIKPRVNIKHPWKLSVGAYSWIGEGVWLDNLVDVSIGANVCISQDAYVLTGSHDYKRADFALITKPVQIEDGAWIGAKGVVCPGVRVGRNAVITVGSVLTRDATPNGIYAGNPAKQVRVRTVE